MSSAAKRASSILSILEPLTSCNVVPAANFGKAQEVLLMTIPQSRHKLRILIIFMPINEIEPPVSATSLASSGALVMDEMAQLLGLEWRQVFRLLKALPGRRSNLEATMWSEQPAQAGAAYAESGYKGKRRKRCAQMGSEQSVSAPRRKQLAVSAASYAPRGRFHLVED